MTDDHAPQPEREPTRGREPAPAPPAARAPAAPRPSSDEPDAPAPSPASSPARDTGRRPWIERLGLASVALVLAALFGAVAIAAFAGDEPFLGVMAGIGCLMTLWVGALTLLRG